MDANEPRAIEFTVPAIPCAQPRQRHAVINGQARNYAPTTVGKGVNKRPHPIVEFKHAARRAATEAHPGGPLTGPLRVDVVFVFPRTSNMFWKTRPMPRVPHAKKPDRDNCDKAILDSLKGICFVDDSQVCDGRIEKWIAAGNEQPHVWVRITPVSASG